MNTATDNEVHCGLYLNIQHVTYIQRLTPKPSGRVEGYLVVIVHIGVPADRQHSTHHLIQPTRQGSEPSELPVPEPASAGNISHRRIQKLLLHDGVDTTEFDHRTNITQVRISYKEKIEELNLPDQSLARVWDASPLGQSVAVCGLGWFGRPGTLRPVLAADISTTLATRGAKCRSRLGLGERRHFAWILWTSDKC